MIISNEYLKELYYRSLALGFEYAEIDGFKYIFSGKYCILKEINLDIINNNSNIIIPDYFDKVSLNIQHKDVVGKFKTLIFGKRMFYIECTCFNYSWIYKVVAPGLKKLGNHCFSNSSIHELDAPNLIEIGSECFEYSSIQSVISPKLKKIGKRGFSWCKNLQFIDTKNVIKLESEAFKNCVNLKYLNLNSLCSFRLDSIENCSLEKLELISVKNVSNMYKIYSNSIKELVISTDIDNINKLLSARISIENILLCDSVSDFDLNLFKSNLLSNNAKVSLLGN